MLCVTGEGHTVRASIGRGHDYHSSFEQCPEQLLQNHSVSDVSHLTEKNKRRTTFRYTEPPLFAHVCVCVRDRESKSSLQHSMFISVIQVCSFSSLCLVKVSRSYMCKYTHMQSHKRTQRRDWTTWTDCKWSQSRFLVRPSSWSKEEDLSWSPEQPQPSAAEEQKSQVSDEVIKACIKIKKSPTKGPYNCACEPHTRPYRVTINKFNSTACCLFHLHHFHESTMNKGRWKHWRKDVYESLAVKWRALTFLFVIQCSHFCSSSLISPLPPMLFFWTSIKGEIMFQSERHTLNMSSADWLMRVEWQKINHLGVLCKWLNWIRQKQKNDSNKPLKMLVWTQQRYLNFI